MEVAQVEKAVLEGVYASFQERLQHCLNDFGHPASLPILTRNCRTELVHFIGRILDCIINFFVVSIHGAHA